MVSLHAFKRALRLSVPYRAVTIEGVLGPRDRAGTFSTHGSAYTAAQSQLRLPFPLNPAPLGQPAQAAATAPALGALPVQDVSGRVQAQKPVVHRGSHCFSCLSRHLFLLRLEWGWMRLGRRLLRLTGLPACRSLPDPLGGRHLASVPGGGGQRPRPLAAAPLSPPPQRATSGSLCLTIESSPEARARGPTSDQSGSVGWRR
jgi:hypothetical protein